MRPSQAGLAIILRARSYRESDKIVSFLTRDFGKLTGIAMGAKKSRRRFANCLDPLTRVRVYFRTRKSHEVKSIDFAGLDFGCSGSARWLDIQRKAGGDVTSRFQPYSYEKNLDLIRTNFRKIDYLADLPESVLQDVASLSHSSTCAQ